MIKIKVDRAEMVLAEIAAKYYGDMSLDVFLYQYNKPLLNSYNVYNEADFLPIGMIIEVPDDYPDLPRTKYGSENVILGETIEVFAKRIYGVDGYKNLILAENGLSEAAGYLMDEGTQFAVPPIASEELINQVDFIFNEQGKLFRNFTEVE